MKMKALAMAMFASGSMLAAPALAVDFYGYSKVGFFTSPDTPDGNVTFLGANGAPGQYRLGNEGNWTEIGWRTETHNNQETGVRSDVSAMIGMPGSWGEIGIQEMFGRIHNVYAGEGSKLWAGTRFYRRHHEELTDLFYWQNSGTGVGLEDINLGNSKMSLAWMVGDFEGSFVNLPDIRWHDINALGGSLTLGANFAFFTSDEAIKEVYGDEVSTTTGYMLSITHAHTIGPVNNKIVFQYTDGIAAGGFMSGPQVNTGVIEQANIGTGFRIIDHGGVDFNDNWSMAYSAAYETLDYENGNGKDWWMVGIRPAYAWNNWTSTVIEAGYQEATSQAGLGTNTSHKVTLAQTFQVGKQQWMRPQIRLFVTMGENDNQWMEDSKGVIVSGTDGNTDNTIYGAQFEAWW